MIELLVTVLFRAFSVAGDSFHLHVPVEELSVEQSTYYKKMVE